MVASEDARKGFESPLATCTGQPTWVGPSRGVGPLTGLSDRGGKVRKYFVGITAAVLLVGAIMLYNAVSDSLKSLKILGNIVTQTTQE